MSNNEETASTRSGASKCEFVLWFDAPTVLMFEYDEISMKFQSGLISIISSASKPIFNKIVSSSPIQKQLESSICFIEDLYSALPQISCSSFDFSHS